MDVGHRIAHLTDAALHNIFYLVTPIVRIPLQVSQRIAHPIFHGVPERALQILLLTAQSLEQIALQLLVSSGNKFVESRRLRRSVIVRTASTSPPITWTFCFLPVRAVATVVVFTTAETPHKYVGVGLLLR